MLNGKLDQHISSFDQHCQDDLDRWDKLIDAQERNTASIDELTASTKGLIEAWTATQGAIKFGGAIGSFITWGASVAIVGTALAWLSERLG